MMAVTATQSDCMFLIIDNNLPISVDNFFVLNSDSNCSFEINGIVGIDFFKSVGAVIDLDKMLKRLLFLV